MSSEARYPSDAAAAYVARANTYGCGWQDTFFEPSSARPETLVSLVEYDARGKRQGTTPFLSLEGVVEESWPWAPPFLVGSKFALALAQYDIPGTPNWSMELMPLPIANTTPVASSKRSAGLIFWSSYGQVGDLVYVAARGDVAPLIYVANTATGTIAEVSPVFPGLRAENMGLLPFVWAQSFGGAGRHDLYVLTGGQFWRLDPRDLTAPAELLAVDMRQAFNVYVLPETRDVYRETNETSAGLQKSSVLRRTNLQTGIDVTVAQYEGYGGNGLVYDRVRKSLLSFDGSSKWYGIVEVPESGGPPTKVYSAEPGVMLDHLRANEAGTEFYFEESCSPLHTGTRVLNVATRQVQWLWERPGFPLVEGVASPTHNTTSILRLVHKAGSSAASLVGDGGTSLNAIN